MRILMILACSLFFIGGYAQENAQQQHRSDKHHKMMQDLSPEQIAELKTKRMTLALDLTADQQKEIMKLELERAKMAKKRHAAHNSSDSMSAEDKYKLHSEKLDAQIAYKSRMKELLSVSQYETWEKHQKRRHGKKNDKKHKHPN